MSLEKHLIAGAASVIITPDEPHFLFGFPYVERTSMGTHDELLSTAIYLSDGEKQAVFISNDLLYVSKDSVKRIREEIFKRTGIPGSSILVAATHTHSAPVTVDLATSENDSVVPPADQKYLRFFERKVVEAACEAYGNAEFAEVAFTCADASGIGTNRHDPSASSDMEVPVMVLRNIHKQYIACMLVCSMHPTILHENSKYYSGDFPHYVREQLQQEILGEKCPVAYFTGTAGNQTPRHVTRENTFAEAARIGKIVSASVVSCMKGGLLYFGSPVLSVSSISTDLPRRSFPDVAWAELQRDASRARFEELKKGSGTPQAVRSAEVDWFGSEELLYLSCKAHSGGLEPYYESCLPAEVQIIKVWEWIFAAWPGEIFVEYGLALKQRFEKFSLITCANGELQGYIVTKGSLEKGYYEAGNSLFDYRTGELFQEQTIELLNSMQ